MVHKKSTTQFFVKVADFLYTAQDHCITNGIKIDIERSQGKKATHNKYM